MTPSPMIPAAIEPPRNATDRNVVTATGVWKGHITLPCGMVSFAMLAVTAAFVATLHFCFDEMRQIRERLRARETTIDAVLRQRFLAPAVVEKEAEPSKP